MSPVLCSCNLEMQKMSFQDNEPYCCFYGPEICSLVSSLQHFCCQQTWGINSDWAHCVLLHGPLCSFAWPTVCVCMAYCVLLCGPLCTFAWTIVYFCMDHCVLMHGSLCTFAWPTVYFSMAHCAVLHGPLSAFAWPIVYFCMAHCLFCMNHCVLLHGSLWTYVWLIVYICMAHCLIVYLGMAHQKFQNKITKWPLVNQI